MFSSSTSNPDTNPDSSWTKQKQVPRIDCRDCEWPDYSRPGEEFRSGIFSMWDAMYRVRATRAKKLVSSFGTTPLRLFIYIARYIYRSLHRAASLLAHIFRVTRRTVSYGRFTWVTSCIKLYKYRGRQCSVVYRWFSSCVYFLCRLIYFWVMIVFARAS